MKALRAAVAVAILTAAAPAQAIEIGGRITNYVRVPTAGIADRPIQQLSSSVWLEGSAKPTEGTLNKANTSTPPTPRTTKLMDSSLQRVDRDQDKDESRPEDTLRALEGQATAAQRQLRS